jgi:hypothetical protein
MFASWEERNVLKWYQSLGQSRYRNFCPLFSRCTSWLLMSLPSSDGVCRYLGRSAVYARNRTAAADVRSLAPLICHSSSFQHMDLLQVGWASYKPCANQPLTVGALCSAVSDLLCPIRSQNSLCTLARDQIPDALLPVLLNQMEPDFHTNCLPRCCNTFFLRI